MSEQRTRCTCCGVLGDGDCKTCADKTCEHRRGIEDGAAVVIAAIGAAAAQRVTLSTRRGGRR